jgi:hypothetical protein
VLAATLSVVTTAMNLLNNKKEKSHADETRHECTSLHDTLHLAFITV